MVFTTEIFKFKYTRLKIQDGFKYSDMKKVYTIIIYEKTSEVFHEDYLKGAYYHHGKTTFETGLKLELLQEYFLIALDVFKDKDYSEYKGELDKWLALLSVENISDAEILIEKYPELEDIFVEMSEYIKNPEEVMDMFSEALKIMDSNTVKYMIEELNEELDETKSKLTSTENKLAVTIIKLTREYAGTKEQAVEKLVKECGKSEREAEVLVEKYWQN